MDTSDFIYTCLEDVIPDYVELAGEGYVQRIISDVLDDRGKQFKKTEGGYNLDFESTLELIFAAASTVLGVLQLYYQMKEDERQEKLNSQQEFVDIVIEQIDSSEEVKKIAVYIYKNVPSKDLRNVKQKKVLPQSLCLIIS